MREEVLRVAGVTLDGQLEDFSLSIFAGEIMGLLPLNGHGLTALIELLQNNLPIEAGYVYYREELVNSWRAAAPHENRIGLVKSTSCLVGSMTVADNIFVLRQGFKAWLIDRKMLVRQLQPILDGLGAGIDADAYADALTGFERVVVEIVKAVVAGCRLVILREIGSMISDLEMARLHAILRHYAAEGVSFLYIGFHYEELVQICDRTAVYSNGRILKILRPEDHEELYEEQFMRRVRENIIRQELRRGESAVLDVRQLCAGRVQGLTFAASAGECVVVQDLQNQIFDDLLAFLLGDLPAEAGEILLDGKPLSPGATRDIAILREQPGETMLFAQLSYLDNLLMTADHRLPEIWRDARMRSGVRKEWAQRVGDEVFDQHPAALSRKQQYDLVFQRIVLQQPKVVFCVQPYKGADALLRMHIWELLRELMDKGIAIVILAVNLSDAFTLASRLVRVRQDRIEVYEQSEFDHLPFSAPWTQIYKHGAAQKENGEP